MAVARVRVWDLEVRLVHWLLAVAVAIAFVTAQIGGNLMVWHGRAGLAVIALVTFRIAWGFVGSTHARFRDFVRGPETMRAYLRGQWSGVGHNPIGALSVLALLLLLLLQAMTGLFANDDIAFQGYLYRLVDSATSDRLTGVHKLFEPALIALVVAHVGAIAFYLKVKKTNLVKPMITGWKEVPTAMAKRPRGGGIREFFFALAVAGLAAYLASGATLRPPPPPPAVQTPAW